MHLMNLKNQEKISVPVYDYKTHTRTKKYTIIKSQKLIILEGLFALYDKRIKNMLNITGGISLFAVRTSHLYGIKIGGVYKLMNSVDIGLSGNFQLNYDSNNDEAWTWNSTSLILNAGYKF